MHAVLASLRQLLQLLTDKSACAAAHQALLQGLMGRRLADSTPPLAAILDVTGLLTSRALDWGLCGWLGGPVHTCINSITYHACVGVGRGLALLHHCTCQGHV